MFSHTRPIPLSERVPVLENMGFRVVDERTYHIQPQGSVQGSVQGSADVWFHDMAIESISGEAIALDARREPLEACFLAVMNRAAENDGYNALVLTAGLPWRDVAAIRTISRFLRQIRVPYSQDYMWATLRKHARIAADIVTLFHMRFDPRLELSATERSAREADIAKAIETALQAVESLDEDRILRRFVNAVTAAIRTNFYQHDAGGRPKDLIAIKFESRKVDGMPLPRPLYEIFVYSPRVEAVHLRFGKVARGGIRWSDRPQDFRTEILGLVKAQNVKNAVIVPVGAKGGFIPKYLPTGGTREAIAAEGVAAYKLFISTLLDITDNIGTGTRGIIPPPDVIRHEGDDPYLVVAADKGTATFSDIANELAIAHDYWLGDAFASGGSAGFDHKKIGITARGAWESVKRHFREMDINIHTTPFTTVGVGDMSGDVFGNGMLREKTTTARCRLRSSRHFHRPRSRTGTHLCGARTPVRAAAVELAGFQQGADFGRRRRLFAQRQGNPPVAAGAKAVRCRREPHAGAVDTRHPQGGGGSPVLWRHRHLCARRRRDRRVGRRPRQ